MEGARTIVHTFVCICCVASFTIDSVCEVERALRRGARPKGNQRGHRPEESFMSGSFSDFLASHPYFVHAQVDEMEEEAVRAPGSFVQATNRDEIVSLCWLSV